MSNETKWAPTPWTLVNHDGPVDELGPGSDWSVESVAGFPVCFEGNAIESNAANAHLIAAAPDLYEALSEMIDHDFSSGLPGHYERTSKAHAALAKARGQS